ncbi:hypothetical protein METSCH_F02650 [Metschnikowia aff. pulcherrima]|uniref:Uncharacterized protein n=1 Tax=Metschnikowia aff. pulcherrima TaxID=2163413 RepID=A0A4P6XX08_9ASCO|nr:hypothetical protein METSCH_F02650 [Metschnikowia aff. pulcherrima]
MMFACLTCTLFLMTVAMAGLIGQLSGCTYNGTQMTEYAHCIAENNENNKTGVQYQNYWKSRKSDLGKLIIVEPVPVAEAIEVVFRSLKRYYTFENFKAAEFLESIGQFENAFMELVQMKETRNHVLFSHAVSLFRVMMRAAKYMVNYSTLTLPGSELVVNVVELNIRALALSNMSGDLDKSIERYDEKLTYLIDTLDLWMDEFQLVTDAPLLMRVIFRDQTARTRKMLDKFLAQA